MIDDKQIQAILEQYAKHGWSLRRVLLSTGTKKNISLEIFGETEIVSSELDALWFSRDANHERETWELRNMSVVPFALVEVFEVDDEDAVREEARQEMQTQMLERASKSVNKEVTG